MMSVLFMLHISVGAIRFEIGLRYQKSWIGGGGRVSACDVMHMAAALAGCRKALVGTGFSTGCRAHGSCH